MTNQKQPQQKQHQPKQSQPLQPHQQLRLNKFLAERIGVSRREADDLIASGKILVNDKPAVLGAHIDISDKVCYNNSIVPFETDFLYLAFNKPVGYVCSRRAQGSAPTLYDLLPKKYHHLKTVGRLDKDSSGLILLTNDGDFAFQMTHPKFRKNKVYEVELNKPLEPLHQQMISDYGVMLDDGVSRFKVLKDDFAIPLSRNLRDQRGAQEATEPHNDGREGAGPRKTVSQNPYVVILSEGRNRQIRRTFAALGYNVTKLHRTTFGKYEIGHLASGKYDIIEP
ncbi:rRNA pseudouridine synthase [Candidatus Saccharibacteria bacterium]|nr:rRNA pseudouridine synthase [Candidatus Saccharibacteria bacterium]